MPCSILPTNHSTNQIALNKWPHLRKGECERIETVMNQNLLITAGIPNTCESNTVTGLWFSHYLNDRCLISLSLFQLPDITEWKYSQELSDEVNVWYNICPLDQVCHQSYYVALIVRKWRTRQCFSGDRDRRRKAAPHLFWMCRWLRHNGVCGRAIPIQTIWRCRLFSSRILPWSSIL